MSNRKLSYLKSRLKNAYTVWIISTLLLMLLFFSAVTSITIYIDPLFHYHAPLEKYEYPIDNERYQNDGIIRHFEYDSIITGTSMTENFMKSEADTLFNANFIKIPYNAGRYKEINDNLKKAYTIRPNIKYIIRCLDYSYLIQEKNAYREDISYPTYLYNNYLFDDLNYVLNKSILFDRTLAVIQYTKEGNETTTFDEYTNWNADYTFGAESVLSTYTLGEPKPSRRLTEAERIMILDNVRQNVTDLADEHPETTFYLFFPPHSICYWDVLKNDGQVDWQIDAEQAAIEEIIKHSNIRLYSFCNNFELICNLENYKDRGHYGEWVNSWILESMQNDKFLLTADNYQEYINTIRNFYNTFDYSSLRE